MALMCLWAPPPLAPLASLAGSATGIFDGRGAGEGHSARQFLRYLAGAMAGQTRRPARLAARSLRHALSQSEGTNILLLPAGGLGQCFEAVRLGRSRIVSILPETEELAQLGTADLPRVLTELELHVWCSCSEAHAWGRKGAHTWPWGRGLARVWIRPWMVAFPVRRESSLTLDGEPFNGGSCLETGAYVLPLGH